MANARRKRGTERPADQFGSRRTGLEKATAAEKRAQVNVTQVHERLTDAIRRLIAAKSGSAKEDKALRISGAAMKDLIRAKKNLRKAQKKWKKAAAQLKGKKSGKATVIRRAKRALKATHVPATAGSARAKSRRAHSKRHAVEIGPTAGGLGEAAATAAAPATDTCAAQTDVEPLGQSETAKPAGSISDRGPRKRAKTRVIPCGPT
jgi:hypothetical protein